MHINHSLLAQAFLLRKKALLKKHCNAPLLQISFESSLNQEVIRSKSQSTVGIKGTKSFLWHGLTIIEGQPRQSLGKSGWMEKPQCEVLGGNVICVSDGPCYNLTHVSVSLGDSNICLWIFLGKGTTITVQERYCTCIAPVPDKSSCNRSYFRVKQDKLH